MHNMESDTRLKSHTRSTRCQKRTPSEIYLHACKLGQCQAETSSLPCASNVQRASPRFPRFCRPKTNMLKQHRSHQPPMLILARHPSRESLSIFRPVVRAKSPSSMPQLTSFCNKNPTRLCDFGAVRPPVVLISWHTKLSGGPAQSSST